MCQMALASIGVTAAGPGRAPGRVLDLWTASDSGLSMIPKSNTAKSLRFENLLLTACDEDTAIQLLRQSHWKVNSAVARSYIEWIH